MTPSNEPAPALSGRLFDAAFPFHLALDAGLTLRSIGSSLHKLAPDARTGRGFSDAFEVHRPEGPLSFAWLCDNQKTLFVLRHRATGAVLRGQMMPMEDSGLVCFLGSPWLASAEEMERCGLLMEDFAIHDTVVDQLHIYQSQAVALQDVKRLAERLTQQRTELRQANEQLSRQNAELTEAKARLYEQDAEARKLAHIADRTDNAVVLTDAHGRIDWVNRGFTRLTGYSMEELRGQKPGALLQGPETSRVTVDYMSGQLAKGEGFRTEIVNYSKTGRKYWVAVEVQPIRDEAGTITHFMGIESEITARVQAEQRRNLQYQVARSLAETAVLEVGLRKVLKSIVTTLKWQCGLYWAAMSSDLQATYGWQTEMLGNARFVQRSRDARLKVDEGLPGKVWRSRQPASIRNLAEEFQTPRLALAVKSGLRSSFAFPILVSGEFLGAMEFFSSRDEIPDADLSDALTAISSLIGQFIVRQQAQSTLRDTITLQRAILEGANFSIISASPDGIIRTFNRTAEKFLGYSAAEVVGKKTPAMIHDPSEVVARAEELSLELGRPITPGFEVFVAKAKMGIPDEREWTYVARDGHRLPVRLSVTALVDDLGQVTGYVGIAADITEQKKTAGEILQAKEAAEAANRSKSDFLASMSHELRTPLAGILNLSEAMLEEIYGPLTDRQKKFVHTIEESGRHLLALINDILDLAKIEAGRMEHELAACSADEITQAAGRLVAEAAHRKGLVFAQRVEPRGFYFDADRRQIIQILVNLVSNAIKFTPEHGTIELSVRGESQDGLVRFMVRDSGIGISAENQQRLFQPFVQLDSRLAREYSGTGLGLALVRKLAEAHGGKVTLESKIGEGSCFQVVIPWRQLQPRPSGRSNSVLASAPSPTRPNPDQLILVVDDNEVILKAVTSYLQHKGYTIRVAHNGREACELAQSLKPRLILMDIQMPEVDGFTAMRTIRALPDPTVASIPIVALTALAMAADRERCLAAGASAYLSKPVEFPRLMQAIVDLTASPSSSPPSVINRTESDIL